MRPSCEVVGVGVAQRLLSGRQVRKIHVVLVETRQYRQQSITFRMSCFGLSKIRLRCLGHSTLSRLANALKRVRVDIKLGKLQ